MKIFGKLIPESVKDNAGNVSSTRIQSYHILKMIYGFAIFIVISEIVLMIQNGNTQLSSQFMIAFGGLLTHHLALLGINKNSKSEPSADFLKVDASKETAVAQEETPSKHKKQLLQEDAGPADPEEDLI